MRERERESEREREKASEKEARERQQGTSPSSSTRRPQLKLATERMWHMSDIHGQIMALAFRIEASRPFKLFSLLRWPASTGCRQGRSLRPC